MVFLRNDKNFDVVRKNFGLYKKPTMVSSFPLLRSIAINMLKQIFKEEK